MIQLEEIHIKKFRGIRELTLTPKRKSFAIQGPNGSGKSGVVDAIDFCLTGDISRLSGPGTKNVTVKKHGAHVDSASDLKSSVVSMKAYLPTLNKSVTITRNLKSPKSPIIEPTSPEIVAELEEMSHHPELALSRRQIIQFVLTTGTQRSKDIQALLRLNKISEIRAALKSAKKSAANQRDVSTQDVRLAAQQLGAQLEIESLKKQFILEAINQRRAKLSLAAIEDLAADTSLLGGVKNGKPVATPVLKATAIGDLKLFAESSERKTIAPLVEKVVAVSSQISEDPKLRFAVQQKQLVSNGMELLLDPECPLCNNNWDMEELKAHLEARMNVLSKAEKVSESLLVVAKSLRQKLVESKTFVQPLIETSKRLKLGDEAIKLAAWASRITAVAEQLTTNESILAVAGSLVKKLAMPAEVETAISSVTKKVSGLPDENALNESRAFLTEAEKRLNRLRDAKRVEAANLEVSEIAEQVYNKYCVATESILGSLFQDVQTQFMSFYRAINADDESQFTASLTASETTLDFNVDFHQRGEFPPAAYHSEGHQDAMGLCLYLALMQKVFGSRFRMVVLDDVVMSVDVQHRRMLCDLLRKVFPDTQFIITTHEKAWFKQMQSTKLIPPGNGKEFLRWTVDQGPIVADAKTAWEKIDEALADNDIPEAAFRLRNHLEHVAPELVEELGGSVTFRADGAYNGGQMLTSAVGRLHDLLKRAAQPEVVIKDSVKVKQIIALVDQFKTSKQQHQVESWAVNKAVHFNPWAEFGREEFALVVAAFKQLLDCFRCPDCESWLYMLPRGCFTGKEESLRCDCATLNFNLKKPNKVMRSKRKSKPADSTTSGKTLF